MARKMTRSPRKARSTSTRKVGSAAAPAELVVITRRQAAFRASAGRFLSAAGGNLSDVQRLLSRHSARFVPIFGPTEERVMARVAALSQASQTPLEDLSVFYRVEAPAERLDELRAQLADHELIEA